MVEFARSSLETEEKIEIEDDVKEKCKMALLVTFHVNLITM